MMCGAFGMLVTNRPTIPYIILGAAGTLLTTAILIGAFFNRTIVKIVGRHAWFSGFRKPFLDSLPKWPR